MVIRERAVRAFAGAVVGLRFLVVLAWIAAALAVTWWLPGLGSGEPLPLGGLIPENAESAQIAQRDAVVRRLVWICVLVIASVIGVVLAARL